MATSRKNTSAVANESFAGVDALIANAFVPDTRDNGERKDRWDVRPIVTYVRHDDDFGSLFDSIDAFVEKKSNHLPNGENDVVLLGADLWHNNDNGKEFIKLTIKSKDGKAETSVNLFPGNEYTDRYGVVHGAGHNWIAFAEEVKKQYNKRGLSYNSKGGFAQLIRSMPTFGFKTWILFDGKYTNMYVTEDKYNNAVDKLARESKKGNPVAAKPTTDDKPPFDVDKK